jgi:gamma-glutamyltranspeptidase/glutathione hydrolase
MVSLTATQGEPFGSKVVIDGLGLAMGHGMSRFDFIPGHPNYPEPGKRMQHNMCPVIILKGGKPYCAIGLPGGRKIVSVTPQLIMNLLDHRMSVSKAISAPRVHTDGSGSVQVSKTLPDGVFSELKKIGHNATRTATVGGPATGLVIDGNGNVSAASEAGDSCVGSI